MKKIILIVMAMAAVAMPVTAQKVNRQAIVSKLNKSDADVADAKKSMKAATWMNRAKVYGESITEPTKDLFQGADAMIVNMTLGAPSETREGGVCVYPWVDVYMTNNKVVGWDQTEVIREGAFDVVCEAYTKAYELDAKQAAKIKAATDVLINYYKTLNSVSVDIHKYEVAYEALAAIIRLQDIPVYQNIDPTYYYYAGRTAAVLGETNENYWKLGMDNLVKAKELGYMDETGTLYYYLFYCYYGQKAKDASYLMKAKETLLEGVEKFPKNERILDGLMSLYTSEDGVGDPADIVSLIDKALAETPDNADLWFGRGRVFYKLKNYDECVASFQKIVELKPNDFDANFYLGYFYTVKGDAVNKAFNARAESISSNEEYLAGQKEIMDAYTLAVAPFEKAFEINPESVDCAQSLKELCFRLRSRDGMKEKYEKYNAAYKKLKGIE